ncbi:VOC family protein [Paracoccus pacificus]|uniref:VOC family protein n=1 Tax=Paracoccus pacificus TaxID=1463598 RepID=A0ABW4R495_9RHOB
MLRFDHLAIACTDLDSGADWLTARLGTRPQSGGAHDFMATHNRLLRLGPGEYLELIAIDPDAPPPSRPRWFGLDGFDGPPRAAGWVLRSDDLDHERPPDHPVPQPARRGDLRWRITIPDSGQMPMQGLVPMLIEWAAGSRHPADNLPDAGLRLTAMKLTHPDPAALARALPPFDDARLMLAQGAPGLHFHIQTPTGDAWL